MLYVVEWGAVRRQPTQCTKIWPRSFCQPDGSLPANLWAAGLEWQNGHKRERLDRLIWTRGGQHVQWYLD